MRMPELGLALALTLAASSGACTGRLIELPPVGGEGGSRPADGFGDDGSDPGPAPDGGPAPPAEAGYELSLGGGHASLAFDGAVVLEGTLVPDASDETSNVVLSEAPSRCGYLYLTKEDPSYEGPALRNAIIVRWIGDGSSATGCDPAAAGAAGIYDGTADSFDGLFVRRASSVGAP